MGLFSGLFGGGKTPSLRPPGSEEQTALSQLVQRGAIGTQLSEAQVTALMQLIGPETATQLQALQQLQGLLGGQPFTSPTVEAGIRRQRDELNERLMRQLGPGGEISTPGRAALSEFGTQSEIFREQARGQELGNLLQVLGLLGPQGAQRAQLGFAEPSPGILRTTGVQERLGELGARSRIAEALIGQGSALGVAGIGGLGKAAGFGLEKLLPLIKGLVAAPATSGASLALPALGGI